MTTTSTDHGQVWTFIMMSTTTSTNHVKRYTVDDNNIDRPLEKCEQVSNWNHLNLFNLIFHLPTGQSFLLKLVFELTCLSFQGIHMRLQCLFILLHWAFEIIDFGKFRVRLQLHVLKDWVFSVCTLKRRATLTVQILTEFVIDPSLSLQSSVNRMNINDNMSGDVSMGKSFSKERTSSKRESFLRGKRGKKEERVKKWRIERRQ